MSQLPVVSHPWAFHAFSAWWFLTDPSSSACPAFPWIHCCICICNTLCQKYIHGFLPIAKQTTSCDWSESDFCRLLLLPSVPLLEVLVNNLPPALPHHIGFWSQSSVLHLPSLLASKTPSPGWKDLVALLTWAVSYFCDSSCFLSDPSYSLSWRGMKDGVSSRVGKSWS